MDIWDAVREERIDLADRLAVLGPPQWDSASLCSHWRVRDVLGHVTAGARGLYGIGPVLGGLVRHGFNFNRWMETDGAGARYRRSIDHLPVSPGRGGHSQDPAGCAGRRTAG
jgi:uncharacterized protein (TIGR03083 family)